MPSEKNPRLTLKDVVRVSISGYEAIDKDAQEYQGTISLEIKSEAASPTAIELGSEHRVISSNYKKNLTSSASTKLLGSPDQINDALHRVTAIILPSPAAASRLDQNLTFSLMDAESLEYGKSVSISISHDLGTIPSIDSVLPFASNIFRVIVPNQKQDLDLDCIFRVHSDDKQFNDFTESSTFVYSNLIDCPIPKQLVTAAMDSDSSKKTELILRYSKDKSAEFTSDIFPISMPTHPSSLSIESMLPESLVSMDGKNQIVIKFTNALANGEEVYCHMELGQGMKRIFVVKATSSISTELWQCPVPKYSGFFKDGDTLNIYVSLDRIHLSFASNLKIIEPPMIFWVYPTSAFLNTPDWSNSSKKSVEVHGYNFRNETSLKCRFGSDSTWESVPAQFSSASSIKCPFPPHKLTNFEKNLVPGLYITVNGHDYYSSSNAVNFHYFEPVRLSGVSPNVGHRDGGTPVDIIGEHFQQFENEFVICHFGPNGQPSSLAIVHSDTHIRCISPPAVSTSEIGHDNVVLQLSVNRHRVTEIETASPSSSMIFQYFASYPVLKDFFPRSGPISGQTLITLIGRDFGRNFTTKECVWSMTSGLVQQKYRSTADRISDKLMQCLSPSVPALSNGERANLSFHLELNEMELKVAKSSDFTYFSEIILESLSISETMRLPEFITVYGQNFVSSEYLSCAFNSTSFISRAVFLSSSAVRCPMPNHLLFNDPDHQLSRWTTFLVSVSNNGLQFSSATLPVRILKQPQITEIHSSSPLYPGSSISIQVKDLYQYSSLVEYWFCVLDDVVVSQIASGAEQGKNNSTGIIECEIPQNLAVGEYSLELALSAEGNDKTQSGMRVRVLSAVILYSISPEVVPRSGGETRIVISGDEFVLDASSQLQVQLKTSQQHRIINGQILSKYRASFVLPGDFFQEGEHEAQILVSMDSSRLPFKPVPGKLKLYEIPHVLNVEPKQGPLSGASLIAIIFSGNMINIEPFQKNELQAQCRFGYKYIQNATLVVNGNSTTVNCFSPSLPQSGNRDQTVISALEFSLNGGVTFHLISSFQLLQYPDPVINRIFPDYGKTGNDDSSTIIGIYGDNFLNTSSLRCIFNNEDSSSIADTSSTSAVFISRQMISCAVPFSNVPKSVDVKVSMNEGVDISKSQVKFHFLENLPPVWINPSSGPILGGTSILISSSSDYGITKCRFNDPSSTMVVVEARKISPLVYTCVTPSMASSGFKLLYLSNANGDQIGSFNFTFYHAPIITSINPSVIRDNKKDTILTLFGENFASGFTCRFAGNIISPSSVVFNTSIATCVFPSAKWTFPAESLSVEVSNNNGVDFLSSKPQFVTVPKQPVLYQLAPIMGYYNSSTLVTIEGESFLPNSTFCHVVLKNGTEIISSAYAVHSSEKAICLIAGMPCSTCETIEIDVSVNGKDRSRSTESIMQRRFTFHKALVVKNIRPSAGHEERTTTILVTLEADNGTISLAEYGISCIFNDSVQVKAKFHQIERTKSNIASTNSENNTALNIQCDAPPHRFGIVPFHLSTNDGQYLTQPVLHFEYLPPVSIYSIHPSMGHIYGNDEVLVSGHGFPLSEFTNFKCKFNSTIVEATYLNISTISCLSPAHVSGKVDVQITVNGHDFIGSSDALEFFFLDTPVIERLSPTRGSNEGNTLVTILGSNIRNLLSNDSVFECAFGSTRVPASLDIHQKVVDEHHKDTLKCLTPSMKDLEEVSVTIWRNQFPIALMSPLRFQFIRTYFHT